MAYDCIAVINATYSPINREPTNNNMKRRITHPIRVENI